MYDDQETYAEWDVVMAASICPRLGDSSLTFMGTLSGGDQESAELKTL